MIRNLFRIALFFAASSGFAATITVNSLSDGSGCSLRNAILAANTNAVVGTCTAGEVYPPFVDSIVISVTGTYAPSSALPAITEPADITATLPNFVLDGTGAGATTTGLAMSAAGTVRGLVIQNFGGYGVDITASGVNLYGNRIGTDPTATSAASNCTGIGSSGAGVRILSTATNVNTIEVGGTTQADHNVISGNQCHGVLIDASGSGLLSATVQGNYIGTTFCGCDAIPNSGYGVVTQGAKAHVVIGSQFPFGTNCQGRCNVIASNVLGQIKISNGLGTSVENNVIGANANMSSGLPADTTSQTGDGILVTSGWSSTINGTVIVRSTGAGVRVDSGGSADISFSRIGASAQGSLIPNGVGVHFHDTTSFTGVLSTTIVGNKGPGIWLDGSQGSIIRQNNIGFLGGSSVTPAANEGGGIVINNSALQNATNNLIGGNDQPNTIAYNTIAGHGPGVSVISGFFNLISQNSIYGNIGTLSSLAIDLGGDGPTPNDPCDSDTGPNNRQNAPVITVATRAANSACNGCNGTRIFGTLVGQANTTYHIEVFTNPPGSPTPDQAQSFLGATDVTTDASCNGSWVVETGGRGQANVTATATSPAKDTSEVSAPLAVWPGQPDPRYDSNADGFTDILLRNSGNGNNASWLLDGTGSVFGTQNLQALPNLAYHLESSFYLATNGLNRNILWRNYSSGANAVWIMPAAGADPTSIVNLPALPNTQYYVGGTADFDGDGNTDILWRNDTSGAVALWLMNGTNYSSTVNLPSVLFPEWTIAGTGDFNKDGRADIVWHNINSGANAIWLMDGVSYSSTVNIQAIPNTAYRIAAIGEYNRDGYPDIVWHNTTSGANAIWLMNGTNVSSTVNLPTVPNTAIAPVAPR